MSALTRLFCLTDLFSLEPHTVSGLYKILNKYLLNIIKWIQHLAFCSNDLKVSKQWTRSFNRVLLYCCVIIDFKMWFLIFSLRYWFSFSFLTADELHCSLIVYFSFHLKMSVLSKFTLKHDQGLSEWAVFFPGVCELLFQTFYFCAQFLLWQFCYWSSHPAKRHFLNMDLSRIQGRHFKVLHNGLFHVLCTEGA